jgi:hypothetical protein
MELRTTECRGTGAFRVAGLGLNLFYALETALVKTRGSVVRDLDLHSCNIPVFQALRWGRILHGGIVPIRRPFLALFMHRRQLAVRLQFCRAPDSDAIAMPNILWTARRDQTRSVTSARAQRHRELGD